MKKKTTIGELCTLINGHGFSKAVWSESGLPIIRIQNLNGSRQFNYFDGEIEDKWLVEEGDLLYAWAGVVGVSFGPCLWNGPRGLLNQHIFRIVPNDGVDRRYLYAALEYETRKIERKSHGFKSNFVHIRRSDLTDAAIRKFSPRYQKAIGVILGEVDNQLLQARRTESLRVARKAGLMRNLLSGRGRSERMRTDDLVSINQSNLTETTNVDHQLQYLDVSAGKSDDPLSELETLSFGDAPSRARRLVKRNDVLFSTVRPHLGGHFAVAETPCNLVASTGFAVMTPNEGEHTGFIEALVQSERFLRLVMSRATGSNYPAISASDLASIRISIPDCKKRRADIGQLSQLLDREISLLRKLKAAIEEQKRGVMERLLSGEVTIPDDVVERLNAEAEAEERGRDKDAEQTKSVCEKAS
ncbi:MAG: restriction endonuclease subunit S [Planctomycetota bacterium]